MKRSFRYSAAFGKRIKYWIIGLMLKEDIDVCTPLVDDNAINTAINKKEIIF